MFEYTFRFDFSDGTFETVSASGFESIDEAKASLVIGSDVEFVSTVGIRDLKPQVFLAW